MGLAALAFGTGRRLPDSAVDATVKDQQDCQCLGQCKPPTGDIKGNHCIADKNVLPCMDSNGRTVYALDKPYVSCKITYGEDDCAPNPCANTASCVDGYDSYKCVCRAGWSGKHCKTEVMTEYIVEMATAAKADAKTSTAIFVKFRGSQGDVTSEYLWSKDGLGEFKAKDGGCPTDANGAFDAANKGYKKFTITARDVGTLHKVTYWTGGDDSFEPSFVRVEQKGTMFATVGKLEASEKNAPVSVTLVKARKYNLKVKAAETPDWSGTKNDVKMQLTGKAWQVSGEVVAVPGGIKAGTSCDVVVWGADVGTPAKVTYWVDSKKGVDADSFLPAEVLVNGQYGAEITTGGRCIVTQDPKTKEAYSTPKFVGHAQTGRGFAFKDKACTADKVTGGCTGFEGCRKCVLYNPDAKKDEVLCPWTLPYSDGRYIIVDLADEHKDKECKIEADPVLKNGAALPDACKKGKTLKSGVACKLACKDGYVLSGDQPKCQDKKFSKGTLKCTDHCSSTCSGDDSTLKGKMEYCDTKGFTCCDTKDKLETGSPSCAKKPCWNKGKNKCPGMCKITETPVVKNAQDIPDGCKKDKHLQNGHKCEIKCKDDFYLNGKQPSCTDGTYSKGSLKCVAKCVKDDGSTATAAECACLSYDKSTNSLCAATKKCTAGKKDAPKTAGTCA